MDLEASFTSVFGIATWPVRCCCWRIGDSRACRSQLSEPAIARCIYFAVMVGLISALAVLVAMLFSGDRHVPIELGNWINLPEQKFHFHLKFVFDRLSVPFVILTFLLCGTIGAFTSRYLHRETGFVRFYIAYALFMLGMMFATLAGTIEVLFFGWELVGLSSALLIAFFHERRNPVKNGLIAWCVYRIADAAFLDRGRLDAPLDRGMVILIR